MKRFRKSLCVYRTCFKMNYPTRCRSNLYPKWSNPACRSSRSEETPHLKHEHVSLYLKDGLWLWELLLLFSMCQRTRATRTQLGVPSCIALPSAMPLVKPSSVMTFPKQTGSSSWLWSPAPELTLRSRKVKGKISNENLCLLFLNMRFVPAEVWMWVRLCDFLVSSMSSRPKIFLEWKSGKWMVIMRSCLLTKR